MVLKTFLKAEFVCMLMVPNHWWWVSCGEENMVLEDSARTCCWPEIPRLRCHLLLEELQTEHLSVKGDVPSETEESFVIQPLLSRTKALGVPWLEGKSSNWKRQDSWWPDSGHGQGRQINLLLFSIPVRLRVQLGVQPPAPGPGLSNQGCFSVPVWVLECQVWGSPLKYTISPVY